MRKGVFFDLSRLFLVGISVLLLVIPIGKAQADVGPKPSMDFTFEYEDMQPLDILGGALIECEDSTCTSGLPLEELGPQGFVCDQNTCNSFAYGYAPYHRLLIDFSDGVTRQSNVFEKRAFNANYTVTVRSDGLQVDEGWGTPEWLVGGMMLGLVFGPVLLCLVGLGGLALVIIFIFRGSQGKAHFSQSKALFILAWISSVVILGIGSLFYFPLLILVASEALVAILGAVLLRVSKLSVFTITLLANLLTIPIILLAINFKGNLDTTLVALIAWLIAWILEGVFLGLCLRRELGFVKAFGLALALNLASLVVSFLLPAGMGFGL